MIPKKKRTLQQYAMVRVAKSGIRLFDKEVPTKYLTLPEDLTNVSDKELGQYLYAFTQQKGYVRTLVSIARVSMMDVQREYDEVFTRIYNKISSNVVSDKKQLALGDPKVLIYREKLDKAQSVLILAEANQEALSDLIFTLSREITRRERSQEEETREHNVSQKRRR